MGERKVLNKYIPADFDPTLIPRGKKLSAKDGTVPVRMMLPFSVQCDNCHTFLYRGRKFNSKKEAMGGPNGKYLGITRWRFYIKCTHCSRPLSFLTDPKNADYEMESGGTRNYEVYKDKAKTEEESALEKDQEEKDDVMKALENRVLDSQREMADLDNLEEIKAMNRRHVQLLSASDQGFDAEAKAVMAARAQADKEKLHDEEVLELTAEEEAMLNKIKNKKKSSHDVALVRLSEEDEMFEEERRRKELERIQAQQREAGTVKKAMPRIKVKRKKATQSNDDKAQTKKGRLDEASPTKQVPEQGSLGLAGLLGGYGSDSASD